MRDDIKIKLLENLLNEVTKRYDYFLYLKEETYKKAYLMAVKDDLTGLYNRYYVKDYLIKLIEKLKRVKSNKLYLIFIDLDNFKPINDIYGHQKGDEVLKEVAQIFAKNFRNYDIISRFGGDEFIILFESDEDPIERISHLRKEIENNFKKFKLSFSHGISIFPEDIKDINIPVEEIIESLIEIADNRMYEEKKKRKNIKN